MHLCVLTLPTHFACQWHPESCPLKHHSKQSIPTYVQMFIRAQLLHTIHSQLPVSTLCIVSGCHWQTPFYCPVCHYIQANDPCEAVNKTYLIWSSLRPDMTWVNRCWLFVFIAIYFSGFFVQTTLVYAENVI